jgi:hypothetical protein
LGTVTTQSPSLVVVMVVPFDDELAPELDDELLACPLPELTVTEGPPVVELWTPPGPAVTELDRFPVLLALSEGTTRQGLPFGPVVTIVLPETPPAPVVTVLVCAWLIAKLAISSVEVRRGRARRSIMRLL